MADYDAIYTLRLWMRDCEQRPEPEDCDEYLEDLIKNRELHIDDFEFEEVNEA